MRYNALHVFISLNLDLTLNNISDAATNVACCYSTQVPVVSETRRDDARTWPRYVDIKSRCMFSINVCWMTCVV